MTFDIDYVSDLISQNQLYRRCVVVAVYWSVNYLHSYFCWELCYVMLAGRNFHSELNGQMENFKSIFDSVKLNLRHTITKSPSTR